MLNANVTVNLLYCDIFHNKFNKFNKTGVRMLDSIYQKWHKNNYAIIKISFLAWKLKSFAYIHVHVKVSFLNVTRKSVSHLWFIDLTL